MAVTRKGNVIRMTAAGDVVSTPLVVQAIHATPGVTVKDGDGTTLFVTASHGMDLSFSKGLDFRAGLELDAVTTSGTLVLFLA